MQHLARHGPRAAARHFELSAASDRVGCNWIFHRVNLTITQPRKCSYLLVNILEEQTNDYIYKDVIMLITETSETEFTHSYAPPWFF